MEMGCAQPEDAKEATADRTPEGPDTHRVFRGYPTQGRSCGGQERSREEDYGSKRPAPDHQEDAPEAEWQTIPDQSQTVRGAEGQPGS